MNNMRINLRTIPRVFFDSKNETLKSIEERILGILLLSTVGPYTTIVIIMKCAARCTDEICPDETMSKRRKRPYFASFPAYYVTQWPYGVVGHPLELCT